MSAGQETTRPYYRVREQEGGVSCPAKVHPLDLLTCMPGAEVLNECSDGRPTFTEMVEYPEWWRNVMGAGRIRS